MGETDVEGADEGLDATERDALVAEWESLQNGIQNYKNQYHRRVISGTVVLAAVAGYAVQAETEWLLAFIPVIIGLIFALHVQETNNVYYRSWQCYRIEEELGVDAFDWTTEFAGLTRPNTLVPKDTVYTRYNLSLRFAPSGVTYLIGALVYVGFATYSVLVVPDRLPEAYRTILGVPTSAWSLAVYVLLAAILVAIGYTHWQTRLDFDEWRERRRASFDAPADLDRPDSDR